MNLRAQGPSRRGMLAGGVAVAAVAGLSSAGRASITLTGAGKAGSASAISFAPGAISFHPQAAVAVSGSTLGANGGVDTTHGLFMLWLRGNVGASSSDFDDANWTTLAVDAASNVFGDAATFKANSESVPGMTFTIDSAGGDGIRANSNDATGGTNHASNYTVNNQMRPHNAGWHHYAWVWDTNFTQGNKRATLYIDGVKQGAGGSAEIGTVGAFNVAINAAGGWGLNVTGAGNAAGAFDAAQVYLNTIDTGLIDASNNLTIPTTKFITAGGLPVDFGATGSLVTGTRPDVLLDGDKTTFATNKGSATGTIAVVYPNAGIVTSPATTPAIYNASVGPAGPQDARPYLAWKSADQLSGSRVAATTTFALTPVTNRGNPIVAGDLLVVIEHITDTTGSHNRTAGMSTPSGWTLLSTSGSALPLYNSTAGWPQNLAVFYKIAGAGDVTAAGSAWSAPPTLSWTADATNTRSATWLLLCYKQASSIQAAAAQINAAVTTATAPTVTPSSAATTLLTLLAIVDPQDAGLVYPPSGQELRFNRGNVALSNGANYVLASDEKLTGTSATGTRTTTQGLASATLGVNIVIGP